MIHGVYARLGTDRISLNKRILALGFHGLIDLLLELFDDGVLHLHVILHLHHAFVESLLVDGMLGALLQKLFYYSPLPDAFFAVGVYLLFHFFGLGAPDVFPQYLQLVISLDDLVFELSDLFFEWHDQKRLLLVFLGSLSELYHTISGIWGLRFGVRLCN